MPRHRLDGHAQGVGRGQPVRGARVGERLGHERHEGGPAAHERHRRLDQGLLGQRDHAAGAAEQLEHLVLGPVGRPRARHVAEHAAAHLGGDVGDEAVDRHAGIGLGQLIGAGGGEDRDDHARAVAHLGGHLGELLRLVAEHDRVGALGQLGVGRHGLAAQLRRQRVRLAGVDVGHQHGLADAARERGRHVPRADEPQLHAAEAYRRVRPQPAKSAAPIASRLASSSA